MHLKIWVHIAVATPWGPFATGISLFASTMFRRFLNRRHSTETCAAPACRKPCAADLRGSADSSR